MRGVLMVSKYRVTQRCGHAIEIPTTTSRKWLENLVKSDCQNCWNEQNQDSA